MKLHSLFVTGLLVMSVIASAFPAKATTASEAAERDRYTDIVMPGYLEEFADALNSAQMTYNTSYPLSTTEVNDECVALMNGKMISGDVGRALSEIFIENSAKLDNLTSGGSVSAKYCPKYSKMTVKEKSIVWVFILTAMAHFESSCSRTANTKGPNGTVYGYYQLHRGKEDAYDGGKGFCKKGDAGKPIAASKCTLGMLEKQFEVRQGELFSPKSYWDVLRPQGHAKKAGIIKKALMRSSLCNPQTI